MYRNKEFFNEILMTDEIFFSFFKISMHEMENLIGTFKAPIQTREEGISLHHVNYKCVRADKYSVYGKKVSHIILY